jgi:hypothetical protein
VFHRESDSFALHAMHLTEISSGMKPPEHCMHASCPQHGTSVHEVDNLNQAERHTVLDVNEQQGLQ